MSASKSGNLAASVAFYALLGLWSLAVAPIGLVLLFLRGGTRTSSTGRFARRMNWLYGRISIALMRPFVRVTRVNPDSAKNIGPCVIVANHQSLLDLYMLGAQNCSQVSPVTKSWPFRLFPFTLAMYAAGYINADKLDGEKIIARCRRQLQEGAVLVFFPEGRRSRTGKLGKFHTGAIRLALEENLPIVPMIISGSGAVIPPGQLKLAPGEIRVEMLPPIRPEQYARFRLELLPHRALTRHVREIFRKKLEE